MVWDADMLFFVVFGYFIHNLLIFNNL